MISVYTVVIHVLRGRSVTPARRLQTAVLMQQVLPVVMMVISAPMMSVMEQEHVATPITRLPVMMGFTAMVQIPAAAGAAHMLVIPVWEERNVTLPVRKPATHVLIRLARPVPTMAIFVRMMPVMEGVYVRISITRPPVMTGFTAPRMMSVRAASA